MNLLSSNSEVDSESGAVIIKRKPDKKDRKIAELEKRVSVLEKRVSSLSRTARNAGRRKKRHVATLH